MADASTAPASRRRVGGRVREALGGLDHYGAVLVFLIAIFVALGLSDDSPGLRLLVIPALALTLDFILATSGASRRARRWAWSLDAAVVIIAVGQVVLFHHAKPYVTYAASAALTATGLYFAFSRILQHEVISIQTLYAAASVYVLIGLTFAFVLLSAAMARSPNFLLHAQREPSDYVYASFITMTTVGYGDITPGVNLARVLCVLDALAAQLFLATVIARLVAGFGRPARLDAGPAADAEPLNGE